MKIKNSILLSIITICLHGMASGQPRAIIPEIRNNVSYISSSYMPSSYGISYHPINAGDQSLFTWWSPTTQDKESCWLQINYDNPKTLNYIDIHAGSHYPSFKNMGDLYFKNLRIKIAQLEFSDGSTVLINLLDVDDVQRQYFKTKSTTYIRLRPLRYYPSTKWNDPCVSLFNSGYENHFAK